MHDAIKMLRYNHLSKQMDELTFDQFDSYENPPNVAELVPLFYVPALDRFVALSDVSKDEAYNAWCAQKQVIPS